MPGAPQRLRFPRMRALALTILLAAPALAAPSADEARLLRLVNEERARAGAEALDWDDALAEVARAHAAEMRAMGGITHRSRDGSDVTDRVVRAGLRLQRVAENVGRGPSLDETHGALMASPGHRANLLDERLALAGFGVVSGDDGWWIVQDFGIAAPHLSEAEGARAVAAEVVAQRSWGLMTDDELSRQMQAETDRMAARDECRADARPSGACWVLAYACADPRDIPASRAPSCEATRVGVGATWRRTRTRPLGAWFVAIAVAP